MAFSAQHTTDMEGLLEEHEQPEPRRFPRHLAALGAATLALGGVAAAALGRGEVLRASTASVVGLSSVPDGCFKKGMFYTGPHLMAGTTKTLEESAEDCQSRCIAQDGCAHFTFWPDGGCLLTGNTSHLKAAGWKYSNTTIGPKACEDLSEFEVFVPEGVAFCDQEPLYDGPSEGPEACELKCDGHPDCMFYSLWSSGGQHWCKLTSTCDTVGQQSGHSITVYKKKPHAAVVAAAGAPAATAAAGTNGTDCSAYPACVAVGIAGACCPNDAGVALGCCNGFPPVVQVAALAAGSECSAFPGCMALNLTEGGCCPTVTGVRLGCCDA